jgi:DNA-binding beta-propeller fold protein YncE
MRKTPQAITHGFATRAHPFFERSDWPVQTGADDTDAERAKSVGPLRRGREGEAYLRCRSWRQPNTVEVLDLKSGKRVATIPGQSKPQGIFYSADFNKLFVANGTDATCKIFRADDFKLMDSVRVGTDARSRGLRPSHDAGNGRINVYDGKTYALRKSNELGEESDTDNVR